MKNYQKGGSRGFKGDKGGRPSFKPGFKNKFEDRGTGREMSSFKAVCSECSKGCDVPFKPSNDKPVYCRDCFSAKRDKETKEYRASPAFTTGKKFSNERPDTASPKVVQFEHVRTPVVAERSDETKKQLTEISFKLDKLISALEKMNEVKSETVIAAPVMAKKKAPQVVTKTTSSSKKVAPKKVEAKKIEVKKVDVNKAVKSVPAKKVEVKKVVAKSAVKKVAEVKKTASKKVAAKKTK